MSEAELYGAFHDALGAASSIMFGYVSLMSGFLIISYLAAHRLPAILAALVVTLFSLVSALLIFQIFLNRKDVQAINAYMFEQKRSGNLDLVWFGTNPPWAVTVNQYLVIAVTIGGFIGCIAYFFYQRSHARYDDDSS